MSTYEGMEYGEYLITSVKTENATNGFVVNGQVYVPRAGGLVPRIGQVMRVWSPDFIREGHWVDISRVDIDGQEVYCKSQEAHETIAAQLAREAVPKDWPPVLYDNLPLSDWFKQPVYSGRTRRQMWIQVLETLRQWVRMSSEPVEALSPDLWDNAKDEIRLMCDYLIRELKESEA